MDGAGRLARSLRSLRPQADLKAAAIGAVVLLREHLGLRARVPARPVIDREPPNRLIFLLERYLPNRTGVALTVLMLQEHRSQQTMRQRQLLRWMRREQRAVAVRMLPLLLLLSGRARSAPAVS